MRTLCNLLIPLILLSPGIAVAQPNPATPSDLVHRIEAAERAWFEALLTEPLLVSLGTFPDLSEAGAQLASILRERLKLLDRKVISNRQWREHWTYQQQAADELESLYGELVRTASGAEERAAATAKQATAKDWSSLADGKVSNQDAYLISIKTERDSVEERLEKTRESAAEQGAKQAPPAASIGATPFEKRAAYIAELRFRQDFQSERRAVANLELKLVRQQAESGVMLQRALKRDVPSLPT